MEKLKVGIVGLRRGAAHVRSFLKLDQVEVVAVADRFQFLRDRAIAMAAEAGRSIKTVAEFDEMLSMDIDAICVSTNGKQQCAHVCKALNAGFHVLSEVPGAYTPEEWVQIRNAVQLSGKFYMLAENSCFLDFTRYWRKWLLDGRMGAISIAEAEYLHHLPNTLERPDGTRISPTSAARDGIADVTPIWRADQPPIQYLTHELGPMLEVLDDRCVSVTCRSAPNRNLDAPLRVDGQIALFETARGVLLKIMVTLDTERPFEHRYYLYGVEGSAEWFESEKICRRHFRDRARSGWERIKISHAAAGDEISGHGGTDYKVAMHFANALLQGRPSPIDVYRAIEFSLPGMIASRSAELGGMPLSIPDMRPEPFTTTRFWDHVSLPETEPAPMEEEPALQHAGV